MEIYYVFLFILFTLAVSDLMVGVANDAVNFVNSAVGSRAANRWVIMIIASAGVIMGTLFAGGMMDIARKGVFNPEMFVLYEVMVIFLAVMFTDVILLDLYNTFGLPTSTTVSLIFEMLGASVAVSLLKIYNAGQTIADLVQYINTSKALAMISGILSSVIIAFSVALLVQFVIRLIFTFDYQSRLRRYGSIWGAIAITFISYFMIIKGIKGAIFMTPQLIEWINANLIMLMLFSVIFWMILFQLLTWFTRINILKIVVLVGTFSIALAFAANDLVNFIGVPLAGLSSFQIAMQSSAPLTTLLSGLKDAAHPSSILLILAGIIMVITLWVSKKAQTVTKTEVNLGRQWEGHEKFESSFVARIIVRMSLSLLEKIKKITPSSLLNILTRRFQTIQEKKQDKNPPAFDLLRASVNLMVASSLISLGTSLKLPLSTTYVTFMAAMGTSLADRAWGRESAVYRVNGVLTVIGGWFFTALMAFTVSLILGSLIYVGKLPVILVFGVLSIYFVYKTHSFHKRKEKEYEILEGVSVQKMLNSGEIIIASQREINEYLLLIKDTLDSTFEGFFKEKRKVLKLAIKQLLKIEKKSNKIVNTTVQKIQSLPEYELQEGQRFGQFMSSLNEISEDTSEIVNGCYKHINNNHSCPTDEQVDELKKLQDKLFERIDLVRGILNDEKSLSEKAWLKSHEKLADLARNFDRAQVERLRKKQGSMRTNLLLLSVLSAMEKISNHINELVSSIKEISPKEIMLKE